MHLPWEQARATSYLFTWDTCSIGYKAFIIWGTLLSFFQLERRWHNDRTCSVVIISNGPEAVEQEHPSAQTMDAKLIDTIYANIRAHEFSETDQYIAPVRTRRYPRRLWKSPKTFKVITLPRTCTTDEPAVKQELIPKRELWRVALRKEVKALKKIKCWGIETRPANEWLEHTKFVLLREIDAKVVVRKNMPCGPRN